MSKPEAAAGDGRPPIADRCCRAAALQAAQVVGTMRQVRPTGTPMRSVYSAENLIDAQLVKDALESAGIPAFITGSALSGAIGELPAGGLIAVQVPDSAWADAARIAAEIDAWLSEKPAHDGLDVAADGAEPAPR